MINPIYASLFPKREPDPIWNAYADKMYKQINQLFEAGKLLDAYILTIQGRIEYCSKPRKPGNKAFVSWIINSTFVMLQETYPDFPYLLALCWMNPTIESLVEIHGCLTAMRGGCYVPMSQQTKMEIKNQFYVYSKKIEGDPSIIFGESDNDLNDSLRN
jgi:hypothetical protein